MLPKSEKPAQKLFVVMVLGLVSAGALGQENRAGKPAVEASDRRFWAYPQGVLVTDSGVRGLAVKRPKVRAALKKLVRTLSAELEACLATAREAEAPLKASGARYLFKLEVQVVEPGTVGSALITKLAASAPLHACVDSLKTAAAAATLAPIDAAKWASISFQATVMTDAEAQGRGFQFYQGEREWETSLRDNRHWLTCKERKDCVLIYEACEVISVNAAHAEAVAEAARKRKKGNCREPHEPVVLTPSCRQERCGAEKKQ